MSKAVTDADSTLPLLVEVALKRCHLTVMLSAVPTRLLSS